MPTNRLVLACGAIETELVRRHFSQNSCGGMSHPCNTGHWVPCPLEKAVIDDSGHEATLRALQ
jgi:hypothetical protein